MMFRIATRSSSRASGAILKDSMALVQLVCVVQTRRMAASLTDWSGPCVVSGALVPDPSRLHVRGLKNGKVMQDCGCE